MMRYRLHYGVLIASTAFVLLGTVRDVRALDCDPVSGASPLLRGGVVVLIGEIHGTEQAPRSVASLACQALERGLDVVVCLEIPDAERERLERYVERPDEAESFLEGPFWRRDYQDGRSSSSMAELVRALARYREETDRIVVSTIDDPSAPDGRDVHMMRRVVELSDASPGALLLVLTGNIHNRLVRGTRFNPELEPMGYLLAERFGSERELMSLRLTHGGGSAWVCTGPATSDCGTRELDGEDAPDGVALFSDAGGPYTGRLHLGRITASAPAVQRN